jgi:hypothetical protein
MKKFLCALVGSLLAITLIPGIASASPSDTTTYQIICASSGRVNVYLDYGISSITITNPSACGGAPTFYVSDGRSSTWTYSQTISGTTTTGSYNPEGINLETGAIGSTDSFTLTITSASSSSVTFSGGGVTLDIYFNKQIDTFSPDPVAIGQQVTVTGSNLSSVTSLTFRDGSKSFSAATSNRTATQLTFSVPSTVTDWRGITSDVTPGTYRISSAPGKTLTLTAAPTVVSVSAEELARQAVQAASVIREAEKKSARESIANKLKGTEKIGLEIFKQAEVGGITSENIEAVQLEIASLPEESRTDISQVLKIARKYEVVSIICSERVTTIYSNTLIEIGLISQDSENKAALTAAVKKLPISERSSYLMILETIKTQKAEIQARKVRLTTVLALIQSRYKG